MTSRSLSARGRVLVPAVVAVALALVMLGPLSGTDGAAARPAAKHHKLERRAPDTYTPRPGVKFNLPTSKDRRGVIKRHIYRSLQSAPAGSKIRIASWNIQSRRMVDAAIRAHDRGVSVRVIMAKAVADRQREGGAFDRLHRNLRQGNKNLRRSMRSWARGCEASCRGFGGIEHTKMYLFTRVGAARNVVMVSSANMTEVAAYVQWNDMFTVVGRPDLLQKFFSIFQEMSLDKKAKRPYQTYDSGKDLQAFWYPYLDKQAVGDPIVRQLRKVRCDGATGRTGYRGRTVIRIAQTALVGSHGARIADKLRKMYGRGCRIRVLYAVSDSTSRAKLGRVPQRQYVQDTNGDGVYDRYLHMKSMTINGVYGGDTSARVVFNGTANWSPKALASDEAGFRVIRNRLEEKYESWIDYLWNHPHNRTRTALRDSIRVTEDGRVFGRVVRQDGTVINPYAKIQLN